ncbi:hypothetical protein SNE35_02475 [Paucibacter sp. R3-3]|uniref:Type II secretion system protein n=1 Tax=Roseateles agri TaxID=3098619 RepID=A0ABU5DAS9_9BURK|nr:hypothetical protein [Paucibacter sp. R3-3]MDY0743350.1 hypothetical protein [Paucibacter sp. R3-3]
MVLLALAALGLSQASEAWTLDSRRAKEQQLLRIGQAYAHAITRYRDMSPGSVKQLPNDLGELLLDKRFVGMVRHLRELYADPVNHDAPWVAIRDDDGRIKGVRSASDETPLTTRSIPVGRQVLSSATHYSDWQFLADPPDAQQPPSTPSRSRLVY